jgi:hypothetical protein
MPGRYLRQTIKSFFLSAVGRLVKFFVTEDHMKTFYEALAASCGGIGGSVATSVLTFPYRHSWSPSNLNIFVPIGGLRVWRRFFKAVKLAEHKSQQGVSRRYQHTTKAHVVFDSMVKVSYSYFARVSIASYVA